MPLLPALTGTSAFQLPVAKRVKLQTFGVYDAPPDKLVKSKPTAIGQAWVEGDKLHLSEPAKRQQVEYPGMPPIVVLNDSVAYNKRDIERGLEELQKLRDNFALQAATTTGLAGTLMGAAGAGVAGAWKGALAGPKGAIIGGAVGVGANLVEVGRRRWNNDTTARTLKFFNQVIDDYLQACAGRLDVGELLNTLLQLEKEAKALGPAAIAVVAEFEMQLKNRNHPVVQKLMSDYQTAGIRKRLLENRS